MAYHPLQEVIGESNDMKIENVTDINVCLNEYTRKDIISRYLNKTAGARDRLCPKLCLCSFRICPMVVVFW
jgi:hypothetical protein